MAAILILVVERWVVVGVGVGVKSPFSSKSSLGVDHGSCCVFVFSFRKQGTVNTSIGSFGLLRLVWNFVNPFIPGLLSFFLSIFLHFWAVAQHDLSPTINRPDLFGNNLFSFFYFCDKNDLIFWGKIISG